VGDLKILWLNFFKMKKLFVALAFVAILGWLLSSCKSVEKCPAYSKVKVENTNSNNS